MKQYQSGIADGILKFMLESKGAVLIMVSLCCLLLPSCMYWDIGGNIRACAEEHLAVDTALQYRSGNEIVVPECRYHQSPWAVNIIAPHAHGVERYMYGATYTGRYRVFDKENPEASRWVGELREVDEKTLVPIRSSSGNALSPEAVRGEHLASSSRPLSWMPLRDSERKEVTERSKWYPLAVAAAVPFDYAVDPVLSIATTPLAWLYVIGEFCWSVWYFGG